jgi:hypothetical protein
VTTVSQIRKHKGERKVNTPISQELARRADAVQKTHDQGEMLSTVIMIATLAAGALVIASLIVGKAQDYFDGIG